ncbi:thiJ/PfpI family protein [Burkholderia ambifaria AMMD]|uniref:ThiJ/PfpI domain protein n=1 Tax=Burkholderia ambifaria (strain ATCC BAA-244 / DSM 16087 / CCUG 44356 / LMG 19182 / AMMD) TaxID=339670 RepID=Q0BC62_BURCM|nr:DJ-1/PfpI family protein [Burkholderia ambifaria]ABI88261.1 ThiJ/PfpI domain protein [Burkholderia ambifaria AMMD]AJY21682.1 thiJ/PfpI family protein [Burkholderia ambifaria AMMD]MBR7934298.1 DJ-1/PfpI family protein [Burkholderia ambifaria]PEH64590.1 dimethylglycine dehydrogenase [Burkholderia ambifaria]QQC04554.1 DJ-1/PfpI family protein [Burkholderia ambifaria]
MTLHIGLLVFPGVQQLDLTGPHDVLASLPDAAVHLVWKSRDTVASSSGLALAPTCTFDDCPPLDVICVPGGIGINDLLLDAETIAFVQRRAATARYVTSVCTGALLLGVAGLLRGRRATTHWAFHELLEPLGAVPVRERVVRDGNLITGGGVTAGIDFALTIAAELAGDEEAQSIQLALEYAPAPPFDAGSPDTAPASVLKRVTERSAAGLEKRRQTIDAALRAMAR